MSRTGRTGLGSWLEALRAPLLLSPVADVLAGWLLVRFVASNDSVWRVGPSGLQSLLLAALAGCSLLASGMAQNALVDELEDRRCKPERPLPRGAVGRGSVRATWVAGGLLGAGLMAFQHAGLQIALAIVASTSAYHLLFKRQRVAGCVCLGLARGLSMGLGVVAAVTAERALGGPHSPDLGPALLGCGLYATYILGASLHASTDDEPEPGSWSSAGLALSTAVLLLWTVFGLARMAQLQEPNQVLGVGILVWAIVRLRLAMARRPPAAVTGVALSGLHLLHAGVAGMVAGPLAAAAILLLFAVSRALLRVYPPS